MTATVTFAVLLIDRRHGHELAVLDRQQIDRLLDVVSVHHGLAGQRAVEFADCQECLAQRVAGRRLVLVEDMFVQLGRDQDRIVVVLQIRQPVRRPLDLGVPPFQERRQVLVVIKPRCKRGDDEAFRRRSKLGEQLRVVSGGIGGDTLCQAQLPHLRDDQRRVDQQSMDMHHVRVRRTQLQQHAGEVGRLGVIGLEEDDLAAGTFERGLVELGCVDAGLVVDVRHRGTTFAEFFIGVFRQSGDIDLGEREQCIDVIAELRDVGRVGTDRKLQHFFAVRHRRLGLHDRAPGGDEHRDLVDGREPVGRIDAELRRCLGIDHHEFQRMAIDAAGVIHILCCHAHDRDEVGAVAGLGAGKRLGDAELERLLALGTGTARRMCRPVPGLRRPAGARGAR